MMSKLRRNGAMPITLSYIVCSHFCVLTNDVVFNKDELNIFASDSPASATYGALQNVFIFIF